MTLSEEYEFRQRLVDNVVRDLIGPREPREELDDAPLDQYVSGILYPTRKFGAETIDAAADIDVPEDDDHTGVIDAPVSLANRRYPSSMGMTFAVDTIVETELVVELAAARYEEIRPSSPDEPPSRSPSQRWVGGTGSASTWQRVPLELEGRDLRADVPIDDYSSVAPGLDLFCRVRPADVLGRASITLALINSREVDSGLRDPDAFFQPSIRVRGKTAPAPFVPRPTRSTNLDDSDLRSYQLLYRHAATFAVGHGCSVTWDLDGSKKQAESIATSYVPDFELPLSDTNPAIDASDLSMKRLAEGSRARVIPTLSTLADGYENQIDDWSHRAEDEFADNRELLQTANEHLAAATEALGAIRTGIRVLEEDDAAWSAFQLANRAMLIQRSRSSWLREEFRTAGPVEDDSHRWYPFQLAFFLLALPGVVDRESPSRSIVDLLWFPTGGGKTEAYLGLIAFTTFHRRLSSDRGNGVTALMRYTLRLLTIQQFERASLLITACESIRRERDDLGSDEIAIGLWVGRDATPLTRKTAADALRDLRRGISMETGSPIQLHACPWCGHALGHSNYSIETAPPRLRIACGDSNCEFRTGLPVHVVDEDIYDYRPTLLIATVDKFASLPWREKVATLFNLGTGDSPPELIIQDELHLISGPLGTLTGLYETAISALSSDGGIGPKIIASTATIRRAGDQVKGLFAGTVRQFPPPGIDAGDSYFATEMPREKKGTRLYLGLSAPRDQPDDAHGPNLCRAAAGSSRSPRRGRSARPVLDVGWVLQQPPAARRSRDSAAR